MDPRHISLLADRLYSSYGILLLVDFHATIVWTLQIFYYWLTVIYLRIMGGYFMEIVRY